MIKQQGRTRKKISLIFSVLRLSPHSSPHLTWKDLELNISRIALFQEDYLHFSFDQWCPVKVYSCSLVGFYLEKCFSQGRWGQSQETSWVRINVQLNLMLNLNLIGIELTAANTITYWLRLCCRYNILNLIAHFLRMLNTLNHKPAQ